MKKAAEKVMNEKVKGLVGYTHFLIHRTCHVHLEVSTSKLHLFFQAISYQITQNILYDIDRSLSLNIN